MIQSDSIQQSQRNWNCTRPKLNTIPASLTLKYPALDTSMTGAFFEFFSYFFLVCSDTSVHSLSRFTAGQNWFAVFECTWKFLIPTWNIEVSLVV